MAGRIWSVLAALVVALAALTTSASTPDVTGPESASSTIGPTASALPSDAEVGAEGHWVNPATKVRVPLVVVAIVAVLGVVGTLAVRRRPDARQGAPKRVRRHVIVSRGPPAFVA